MAESTSNNPTGLLPPANIDEKSSCPISGNVCPKSSIKMPDLEILVVVGAEMEDKATLNIKKENIPTMIAATRIANNEAKKYLRKDLMYIYL